MLAAPLASGQAADKPAAAAPKAQAPAIVKEAGDPINVAVIGVGAMGQLLLNACLYKDAPLPNLRFKAVCDIWPYNRRLVSGRLKYRGHAVNQYEDYRELLAAEKDLHAVLIATPDWMHAEQTNACLAAGLHVYCENEMSNTLAGARSMVLAARKSGKLLQIGHHRRSIPYYTYALDKIVGGNKILGRIGQVNAQWNRSKSQSIDVACTEKIALSPEVLQKYGYASMHELLNWHWYRKFGSGWVGRHGSHQVDVMNWFLGTTPKSIIAIGHHNPDQNHDWSDNVMCLMEYETPTGPIAAFYQSLNDSSYGGYKETFLGEEGTMILSQDWRDIKLVSERLGRGWDKWRNEKIIMQTPDPDAQKKTEMEERYHTTIFSEWNEWKLPESLNPIDSIFKAHLENFFDAIRRGAPLACPAEQAYATAVVTLAINRAVEAREKIVFKREDFVV